ncbi:MAG: hypothetical protein JXR53_08075 [Bacteroidales bacterium]|nr:hypothetical protein [Bacteroidales bacterium]
MLQIAKQIYIKKLFLLFAFFLSVGFTSLAQDTDFVTFKLKITSHLPVGWGEKYQAVILDVIEGSKTAFGDTIYFGRIDFSGEDFFSTGDTRTVSFKNTKEQNDKPYLPACSCTVSLKNEIWEITEIRK